MMVTRGAAEGVGWGDEEGAAVMQASRRHDLDWLRVLAFATLITYHVGMFYVTWDWHVSSDHASRVLEPVMALVNPWRLGLLFLISGVALRFLLDARGSRTVASDRVDRLLLPLGFGMLVVVMPQAYFELRALGEIDPGIVGFSGAYLWPFEQFSFFTPTWNHLWFLVYILLYSLLLAATHRPLTRFRLRLAPTAITVLRRAPWLVLVVPAVPLVLYGVVLSPLFPPTHMVIGDWATHAHALTMVLLGWFVAKSRVFWDAVGSCLWPAIAATLALGMLLSVTASSPDGLRFLPLGGGDEGALVGLLAAGREVYAWVVIVAIVALGQRYLNRGSRALTYATEAVLPWYILHQTLIVAIGYAMIGSGVPVGVEIVIVLGGTLSGCLLLHELVIRRVRWVRPLFGLKPVAAQR